MSAISKGWAVLRGKVQVRRIDAYPETSYRTANYPGAMAPLPEYRLMNGPLEVRRLQVTRLIAIPLAAASLPHFFSETD